MELGTLVRWTKKEGEKVEVGDVICEIQTDKAVVDFEAQEEGYLAKIIAPDNSKDLQVGALIGLFVDDEEEIASAQAEAPNIAPKQAQSVPKENAKEASASSQPAISDNMAAQAVPSPAVGHIARKYHIDLSLVTGTGPKGRVLKGDVLSFIEGGGKAAAKAPAPAKEVDKPKKAAKAPPAAKAFPENTATRHDLAPGDRGRGGKTLPHAYMTVECCFSRARELVEKLGLSDVGDLV